MFDLLFFAAPGTLLPAAVAGIFGLLIGSFLNVVIHRLPRIAEREYDDALAEYADSETREQSVLMGSSVTSVTYESKVPLPHTDQYNLVLPNSACPCCGHKITALENIPVISYLVLRGKCKSCKTPISIRYPLVETLTGVLSVLLIWHFGSGIAGLASLLFVYLLIAMTFIDADTTMLPDQLTYPLLWCGLLLNLQNTFASLGEAVIGAAAGYLFFWLVSRLFKLIRGVQGMGDGDLKLLAGLGAWFGWKMLPLIIMVSSLFGAVVGLVLIWLSRKGRDYRIPFGPYLAFGGLIALFFGHTIVNAYLGSLGL